MVILFSSQKSKDKKYPCHCEVTCNIISFFSDSNNISRYCAVWSHQYLSGPSASENINNPSSVIHRKRVQLGDKTKTNSETAHIGHYLGNMKLHTKAYQ
jgi:hypothetical protein